MRPLIFVSDVNEDFAPPLSGMPGQFPIYLRLPYRRDSYFCFKQQAKQDAFLSILSDCIRHQNQGETSEQPPNLEINPMGEWLKMAVLSL